MTAHYPQLVSDGDRYRFALEFVQKHETINPAVNPAEVQELHCVNRILFQGLNWCVTKPPKMLQLKTLEICKVCKQRRLGLTEKTLSPSPIVESEPLPLASPQPQPQQKPQYKHYQTIFCPSAGFHVPTSKCELCKRDSFNVYDVCQKQKHPELRIPQPQKGEKQP